MRNLIFLLVLVCFCAAPAVCRAGSWDNCGGWIEYDGDDGRLHQVRFVSYMTVKHDFIWYRAGGKRSRMHVRHPKMFTVYGKDDPITITLRDGSTIDGMLNDPFVEEVTGLPEFTFRGVNGDEHTVQGNAVRRISFGGKE